MSRIRSSYTDSINFYEGHSPLDLAQQFGTPLYVYNEAVLRQRCRELKALSSLPGFGVNYSVKANTNPVLLRIIREEGLVVDAMSPGELYMDRLAGFTADEILYISNNISEAELRNAVEHGVLVSVDSLSQVETLGRVNPGGKVMVRFNPGIGAGHHAKVVTAGKETKFGVSPELLDDLFAILKKHDLHLAGINQHIGSLFMEADGLSPPPTSCCTWPNACPPMLQKLEVIDFGGGFGIPYHKYENQPCLDMDDLGRRLHGLISGWAEKDRLHRPLPGGARPLCGGRMRHPAGERQCHQDQRRQALCRDRPGFQRAGAPGQYDSFHDVEVYRQGAQGPDTGTVEQSVVGNIRESGDILAKNRQLPLLHEGDVLGVLDAGAYGFVMSSSYNQRCRAAEIPIQTDGSVRLIRRRETLEDLAACYEGLL